MGQTPTPLSAYLGVTLCAASSTRTQLPKFPSSFRTAMILFFSESASQTHQLRRVTNYILSFAETHYLCLVCESQGGSWPERSLLHLVYTKARHSSDHSCGGSRRENALHFTCGFGLPLFTYKYSPKMKYAIPTPGGALQSSYSWLSDYPPGA
ncbi:hypothetical protein SCLCIDRAFT_979778 [Scleroderma citrinum Foug A]|uniref:Uncharacterized protein n=1 Tax=Scleroderma citrinum Foug A TaxID=1036808 RepID=A0A0C3A5E4_9AGAM|nr:hypothetical protein SCLCIDRAFT_979778 [Scleroderma citrinum Foug A]